jgi:SNF2 family DNA or RNA helicase
MATLMAFINPSHRAANDKWWRDATSAGDVRSVARAVHNWSTVYIVRREKDVLTVQLPPKMILSENVAVTKVEIAEYDFYEERFLKVLKAFSRLQQNNSVEANWEKKMMFRSMLSLATRMRMALIHPVLPDGGRDLSIHFSPSRRHLAKVLSRQGKCVCCGASSSTHENDKLKRHEDLVGDEFTNGDNIGYEEDDEFLVANDVPRGELVKVPCNICMLSDKGPHHFAHEACLKALLRSQKNCPKCIQMTTRATAGIVNPPMFSKEKNYDEKYPSLIVGRRIVPHIFGGFCLTTKLRSIVCQIAKIPPGDKAIILSFFKGSLDLIEALLFHEMQIEYARFDGDIAGRTRQEELEKFKQDPICRILLMTVQTGGTGLNINEANHVIFVDRWFNPCVHEQAEDRYARCTY